MSRGKFILTVLNDTLVALTMGVLTVEHTNRRPETGVPNNDETSQGSAAASLHGFRAKPRVFRNVNVGHTRDIEQLSQVVSIGPNRPSPG